MAHARSSDPATPPPKLETCTLPAILPEKIIHTFIAFHNKVLTFLTKILHDFDVHPKRTVPCKDFYFKNKTQHSQMSDVRISDVLLAHCLSVVTNSS